MGLLSGVRDAVVKRVARGMLKDAAKGRYGEGMSAILRFLDGKKTWLGVVGTFGPELVDVVARALGAGGVPENTITALVKAAGLFFLVIGAFHRLLKGQ